MKNKICGKQRILGKRVKQSIFIFYSCVGGFPRGDPCHQHSRFIFSFLTSSYSSHPCNNAVLSEKSIITNFALTNFAIKTCLKNKFSHVFEISRTVILLKFFQVISRHCLIFYSYPIMLKCNLGAHLKLIKNSFCHSNSNFHASAKTHFFNLLGNTFVSQNLACIKLD